MPGDGSREPGPHIVDKPLVPPERMAEIEAADDGELRERMLEDAGAWN